MSAVSAYKFHGSQIQVLVGVTANCPGARYYQYHGGQSLPSFRVHRTV